MNLHFYKYQGAGNDFVVLDNRDSRLSSISASQVAALCDRRFGVGADGLLLLSPHDGSLFRMEYFNQDGSRASFCGNGARCICAFAAFLGVASLGEEFSFIADDGMHSAVCSDGWVDLSMKTVDNVARLEDKVFVMNTGVPHYVAFVDDVQSVDLVKMAPAIRFSERFAPDGVNVNFASILPDGHVAVRTYERGVEAETLACGTGLTACAIAASFLVHRCSFNMNAQGGNLSVSFSRNATGGFDCVRLSGPATLVFEGFWKLAL